MTREELAADVMVSLREPRWRDIVRTGEYWVHDRTWTVRLRCGHDARVSGSTMADWSKHKVDCNECE